MAQDASRLEPLLSSGQSGGGCSWNMVRRWWWWWRLYASLWSVCGGGGGGGGCQLRDARSRLSSFQHRVM